MAIFPLILAVLKALPILHEWFKSFVKWYSIKQVQWFNEELKKAVEHAISTGETDDLVKAIKSPKAGKPSGHDGGEFDNPDSP